MILKCSGVTSEGIWKTHYNTDAATGESTGVTKKQWCWLLNIDTRKCICCFLTKCDTDTEKNIRFGYWSNTGKSLSGVI